MLEGRNQENTDNFPARYNGLIPKVDCLIWPFERKRDDGEDREKKLKNVCTIDKKDTAKVTITKSNLKTTQLLHYSKIGQ